MLSNISLGGAGLSTILVSVIMWVAAYYNVPVVETQAAELVQSILTVAGFVMMVVGQLRRKDLKYGVIRK
jgi:hypothetical protein